MPKLNNIRISVTYATNEEIREALETTNQDFNQPRKMMLDIFSQESPSANGAGLRPVLVIMRFKYKLDARHSQEKGSYSWWSMENGLKEYILSIPEIDHLREQLGKLDCV